MSRTLRYGLIGTGMMGREHVRNIALLPDAAVVALADPDFQSRRACRDIVGQPVTEYADHRDLLSEGGIDAVVIASPNDTHAPILHDIFALAPNLAVLVEKPVCTRFEDIGALRQAAVRHKAPLWVGMEYRYMPPVVELCRELAAGTAGRLRMLAIREHRFPFLRKYADWNRFNERTGGTLVEKCCHFFDLMRLLVGSEVLRIYASGGGDVNHVAERYGNRTPDILDNAFAVLDFANGARASLDLCMFAEGSYFQEEIAATGDKAKIECFIPGPARFWPGGAERDAEIVISPRESKGPVRRAVPVDAAILRAGDHHGATYYQHLKFQAAIREGAAVEVTLEDGLRAVAIGLAGERSIREQRAIELPPPPPEPKSSQPLIPPAVSPPTTRS
jgi:myo-inositol 2-dehydrogenase / D-chiro-inositol 1-dehydrogenase